ncbi:hypothetical protein scyTo_0007271 [Scyliorhinus torazame]|uniref:Uncharacterized protein n=1 Tax=Scyliorhinus torazame TaxID=75743 RepID=A0A401NP99_SCYTO|nr:hypothetical protein [Scyliorhinus torazame]
MASLGAIHANILVTLLLMPLLFVISANGDGGLGDVVIDPAAVGTCHGVGDEVIPEKSAAFMNPESKMELQCISLIPLKNAIESKRKSYGYIKVTWMINGLDC